MIAGLEIWMLFAAAAAYFLGGYVKGVTGFALPLVAVSATASFLDAQTAVALVILPVLLANLRQALRQGIGPLLETARRFWLTQALLVAMIILSARLLPGLDDQVFFLVLGVAITSFAMIQLAGWRPRISPEGERPWGALAGVISGFYGGLSGIWGPPMIFYFSALGMQIREQTRATGLCFALGAIALTPSHILTGVLNRNTALLSLAMIPAALAGQWVGQKVQDRMDLAVFQRWTLIVLALSGANLLRRGLLA